MQFTVLELSRVNINRCNGVLMVGILLFGFYVAPESRCWTLRSVLRIGQCPSPSSRCDHTP